MFELDVRTIVFMSSLLNILSFVVIALLWLQNHKKFHGVSFWLADYFLQVLAVYLLYLRGIIPDYISVLLPNCLILIGIVLLLVGFQRFLGIRYTQIPNILLLVVFIGIQTYFTFEPNLNYRTYLVNFGIMVFCIQGALILWHGLDSGLRHVTRGSALALMILVVVTAARIVELVISPNSNNDIFKSGSADMVFYTLQQLAMIYLTFNLILMFNRRLLRETLQNETALKVKTELLSSEIVEHQQTEAALKESEFFNSSLLSSAPYAIIVSNPDTSVRYVNPAFERLIGFSSQEVLGLKTPYPWWCEESIDQIEFENGEGQKTPDIFSERCYKKRNGEMLWVEVHVRPIMQDGKPLYFLANWVNITQRKQAEEELKRRNAYIRTVLDNLPIGVAVNTINDGNVIYENLAFQNIYGWPASKLTSVNEYFEIVYPDAQYRAKLKTRVLADMASGDVERMRWEGLNITTSEGKRKTVNAANIPLLEQNLMISTVQDITERTRALDELTASEERFRSTLENLFEGGQIIGFDWRYVYVNKMSARQGQKTREELIGHSMLEVYPGIENTALFKTLEKCMRERISARIENEFSYSSGGSAWFDLIIQPVKEGLFILSLDITNRKIAEDALRQSEENYHSLFTNMTEAFALNEIILDQKGQPSDYRFLEVNPAFEKMAGLSMDFLVDKTAKQAIPGLEEYWIEEYGKVALSGASSYFENYSASMGKWFRVYAYSPKKYYFVTQFLDISERKITEMELINSEEKYRSLYERMAQGVIYQNAEGEVVSVNAAARRILNVTTEQLHNTQVIDAHVKAVHEDGSEFLAGDHPSMQALRTGQSIKDVIMGIWDSQENSYKWISVNATPQFKSGDSKPYQAFVTFDDISDIKNAELQVKQSEDRLRLILDSTAEAIYGIDLEGLCTFCNPACLLLLGYKSPDEILGRNMHHTIHSKYPDGTDYPAADCRICQASIKGEGSHLESEVFWKSDGSSVPVEYWSYPQFKDGKVIGSVVTFVDITERRQAAARVIEIETLKQINKAKSELLANVSHELRTPLASIKGFIETLLETDVKWSKTEQIDFLRSAVMEADRLTFLIRDLLDMSRLDSGKMVLDKRDYSIEEILGAAANVISVLTANHRLMYSTASGLPVINADKTRIAQVLTNLVENATKFSSAGSSIRISVTLEANSVVFRVEDRGEGMTKEVISNLFNRFYQAERVVSGKTRGTGLGLAICKGIVEAHDGKIWAESEPGKGSSFGFNIPITEV
jgi:PAS domain S-box-containing protein